jgi:hypothetical protein
MNCRIRAILYDPAQRLPSLRVEEGSVAWRLAGNKPGRTLGIEPQNPVAHRLQSNTADRGRRRTCATVVNLGQRQQPPNLPGIARPPGQRPKSDRIEILAKGDRRCHSKPPSVCHVESDRSRFRNPQMSLTHGDLVLAPSLTNKILPHLNIGQCQIATEPLKHQSYS